MGKLRCSGNNLKLPAAPLVFGEIGTESQHSFFQLLHQGIEKNSSGVFGPI